MTMSLELAVSSFTIILSLVFYVVSLYRERNVKKMLGLLEKKSVKGEISKISKKVSAESEKNYAKFSREAGRLIVDKVRQSVDANFSSSLGMVAKERERLINEARVEIEAYKKEKIAGLNEAASLAVKQITTKALKKQITPEIDEKIITEALDDYLNS